MAGVGARATIVFPKDVQFQVEGVGVKFFADVEVECAASNLPALEKLISKAGGTLALKAAAADAKNAAGAVESKLDQYQAATNQTLSTLTHGLQELLSRIPAPVADKADAEKAETPKKK